MSELLRELVGLTVFVWPAPGSKPWVVKATDDGWLQLEAAGLAPPSEYRLIPLRTIRLIKCHGHNMTAQAATGGLARELVGRTVCVKSYTADSFYEDTGVLEAFDDDWLRVRAGKTQLYFGVGGITELQIR